MFNLDKYAYTIDENLVAHKPHEPRDEARLFVYHRSTGQIEHKFVSDLPTIIPGALFVVNDTTVLPARLHCTHNNEPIELLVLVDQGFDNGTVRALVNRRVRVGERIYTKSHNFEVLEDHEKSMKLSFSGTKEELYELLESNGETPLPPYIKSEVGENLRRIQYQTHFASSEPSVAAPTASLHFTPRLIERIKERNGEFTPLTLQVGLGTFAPVFEENFIERKLHEEFFSVPDNTAKMIQAAKQSGRKIVSVGTTVTRTLESTKEQTLSGKGSVGSTDIFIFPPYKFSVPDVLMTNFHVPKSSLMCLVDAFLADEGAKHSILELYEEAMKEKYRFYSFGDAMIIL